MAVTLELGARAAFLVKDRIQPLVSIAPSSFDEYKIRDPGQSWNWRLKSGFSLTLQQAVQAKKRTGRVLAEQYLIERAAHLGITDDSLLLSINGDGFKGPEIDQRHSKIRILTLGDSCTFGTLFDKFSYPRTLEQELRVRERDVEVINGGVEGYGPKNVLARIAEYKALRPEMTTIYLGWNALYDESEWEQRHQRLYAAKLVRKAYQKLLPGNETTKALALYGKPKRVNRHAEEVKDLEDYVPSFMHDVEAIVKELQSVGSRVVILTIPGLYSMDEEPSEKALKIGHLPEFTDNPFVLAKMSLRYNRELRDLAQRYHLYGVDLEEWSKTALRPRDSYFFDSVHLYEEGQVLLGQFLAEQLLPLLPSHPDNHA